ncbi:MAG TPA: hypothetical protein VJN18_02990 [Polyangiaceae bacterium]|nr:hypothetical protein [Polyangiaceae bacterium]
MRTIRLGGTRLGLEGLILAGFALAFSGCSKAKAEELIKEASTFAERSSAGTLHWNVASDGAAALVVENPAGTIEKGSVTGQLTFVSGKETKTVPLTLDEKSGVLRADGPDLDPEVTELRYALLLNGKPWSGALHVPESGTKGLVETAKSNPSTSVSKGPNGGDVQVIDGQRFEIVADSGSGETRVYLLDNGKKPKKLKLALDADPPRQVELVMHEDGYYVTTLEVARTPRKVSLVVVDHDDDAHVMVVGYRPGVILVVDRRPFFWVERGWGHPGLARGHHKGTPWGPPGHFKDKDDNGHKAKGKGR